MRACSKTLVRSGVLADLKQFSYILNDNNGTSFRVMTCLGVVPYSGVLKDGRVWYCPSEQDPSFQYDTSLNVWCFDRPVNSNGYDALNSLSGAAPATATHTPARDSIPAPSRTIATRGAKPYLVPVIDYSPDYRSSPPTANYLNSYAAATTECFPPRRA